MAKKLNIAIVGFGQMGKMINEISKNNDVNVVAIIDRESKNKKFRTLTKESLSQADVCIDFTHPSTIMDNIKTYCKLKKNVVIGTTGWYEHMDEVERLVKKSGIGFIWSGNFSIGVNIYFRILSNAAKMIDKFDDYDTFGVEYHHSNKADSPSGTMKMIGELLLKDIKRKNKVIYETFQRKIQPNEIHLSSIRGGNIVGIHEIVFDSKEDSITLTHHAKNREGFAKGALLAAKFINNKTGFYDINHLMDKIIEI